MTLNNRLLSLLDQSIEEYIRTAAPVASAVLSGRTGNARSPATIRNELKTLEEMGYLHQVHTASGGRIPTTMAFLEYLEHARGPDERPTFVEGLIEDLAKLTALVQRIEHKLGGMTSLIRTDIEDPNRRINVQQLFNDPDTQMSAIYLIIKEKLK